MLDKLKNAEFSKKLLYFVTDIIVLLFVVVTIAALMGNCEPLVAFITGMFSLATISFGFYYWKAKNENIRKYAKNLPAEDAAKIIQIYDAIFKEDNKP